MNSNNSENSQQTVVVCGGGLVSSLFLSNIFPSSKLLIDNFY